VHQSVWSKATARLIDATEAGKPEGNQSTEMGPCHIPVVRATHLNQNSSRHLWRPEHRCLASFCLHSENDRFCQNAVIPYQFASNPGHQRGEGVNYIFWKYAPTFLYLYTLGGKKSECIFPKSHKFSHITSSCPFDSMCFRANARSPTSLILTAHWHLVFDG
jgi:hypothetical protein